MLTPAWEDVSIEWTAWVPAASMWAVSALALVAEAQWKTYISSSILRHPDLDEFKEGFRNILTNLGIVSALVLALSFSLLVVGPIGSVGPEGYLSQLFVHLCLLSFLFCFKAVLYSVINMIQSEPLSPLHTGKYALCNPNVIGSCLSSFIVATIYLFAAVTVWLLAQYRFVVATSFAINSTILVVTTLWYMHGKAKFNPDRDEWTWPSLPEEKRPRWVTWGLHKGFVNLYLMVVTFRGKDGKKAESKPISRREYEAMNPYVRDRLSRSASGIVEVATPPMSSSSSSDADAAAGVARVAPASSSGDVVATSSSSPESSSPPTSPVVAVVTTVPSSSAAAAVEVAPPPRRAADDDIEEACEQMMVESWKASYYPGRRKS